MEIAARAQSAFAAFGLGLENVAPKELSLALAWIAVGYMTYGQKLEIRPVRRKAVGRMRRSEYRLEDVWVWAGDEAQSKASMAVVGVTGRGREATACANVQELVTYLRLMQEHYRAGCVWKRE